MTRSTWIEAGLLAALILLALALLHPAAMFQGKIYSSDDARASAAFEQVGRDAQRSGDSALWNPFVFGGMPAFGSLGTTGDTYPLRKPLRWATWTLGLPPLTWMLFHLFVTGFTTALYLRWRGLSLAAAAMAGALVLALPSLVSWSAYGHGTKVGTFAWMPLALWSTEAFLRHGKGRWLFLLALAMSLQLLRAHVQIAYYSVMMLAIGTIVFVAPGLRDAARRPQTLLRVGLLGVAGLLALGSALVIYLPVLEYQGWSIRGAGSASGGAAFDYATGWSLHLSEIATFWWPTAVGYGKGSYVGRMPFTDYPNYVGGLVLALAAAGLGLRRSRWGWALLAVVVLSTLLALGKHGPLYRVFYDLVPGFKKFRVPVMVLILQQYALVLLAAAGLDAVLSRLRDAERPRWLGLPTLVAAGGLAIVLLFLGTVGADLLRNSSIDRWRELSAIRLPQSGGGLPAVAFQAAADLAQRDALRLGAILAACTVMGVLVVRRRVPVAAAAGVWGVLLFLDLLAVDQPLLHPDRHLERLVPRGDRYALVAEPALVREHAVVREFAAANPVTEFLRSTGDRPRVWPWPGGRWSQTNELASQGIVTFGGYHAAKLKVAEDLRRRLVDSRPPEVRLANLLAADFVVVEGEPFAPGTLDRLEELGLVLDRDPAFRDPSGVVYRNRSAMPRAWLVGEFVLEEPGQDTTDRVPDQGVLDRVLALDPRQTAILSGPPDPAPNPAATEGRVIWGEEGYTWMELTVDTPAPGVLVVAEMFYPGWEVTVDGERARLLRADHALRAVALPAGEHTVEFRFSASSYHTGRRLAGVSGSIIGLGLLTSLILERRRRED